MIDFKKHLIALRFERGRFVLVNAKSLHQRLSKDPNWTRAADGTYETVSLRAAAAFRRHGEENVEKIFHRRFQEHYDLPRLPPLKELDDHQREGLEWILSRKRSYIAHAPGAGKTAQAILAALLHRDCGPCLFIVPPSLVENWAREINKVQAWLPEYEVSVGGVTTSDRRYEVDWEADFVIVPDSMLAKDWVLAGIKALQPQFICVDEASRFKDPLAERSLAFYGGGNGDKSYPGIYRDARHVVFLDGSPMPNRPMELWAPTFALHPEAIDCMDQNDFGYRYCGAKPNERGVWEFLHSSHEAELQTKLQKDFMHVVTEDRLTHPERRRSLLFIGKDVRSTEHKSWERRHLSTLRFDDLDEDMSRGDIAHFRLELGVRKARWVARYVRERLEAKNESILLFAWHREVVTVLAEELSEFRPGVVMGGTKAADRERYFKNFQSGRTPILIMNIAAGGRGHNLQRADRVIFAEYSWSDELNRQCEKRASRRGNDRAFTRCEYMVAPNSMDEPILNSIFTKQRRVKRIIG